MEFSGNQTRQAEVGLTCLQPKTTYHFRIVARNGSGKTFGGDQTFTTTRLHGSIPSLYEGCPKKDWPDRGRAARFAGSINCDARSIGRNRNDRRPPTLRHGGRFARIFDHPAAGGDRAFGASFDISS
jgi:hypothetical protein